MAKKKIPARISQIIESKINSLFEAAKIRFLGQRGTDKTLFIIVKKDLSLPGMYEAASKEEGGIPQLQTLDALTRISKNYIDALKLKTINKTLKDIESHINQKSPEGTVSEVLNNNIKKATSELKRIVESETQVTKNTALMEGIARLNVSMGIEDPTVAFIPVRDGLLCQECKSVHLLEDGVTPRVFKLSQVSTNYHAKGSQEASLHGMHPNCRCQMVTLLPGFGFKKGKVAYISKNHSEFDKQNLS